MLGVSGVSDPLMFCILLLFIIYCFPGMTLGLPMFQQGIGQFNCPNSSLFSAIFFLDLTFSPGFWQLGPAIGGVAPCPMQAPTFMIFWLSIWPRAIYCKCFKSQTHKRHWAGLSYAYWYYHSLHTNSSGCWYSFDIMRRSQTVMAVYTAARMAHWNKKYYTQCKVSYTE